MLSVKTEHRSVHFHGSTMVLSNQFRSYFTPFGTSATFGLYICDNVAFMACTKLLGYENEGIEMLGTAGLHKLSTFGDHL